MNNTTQFQINGVLERYAGVRVLILGASGFIGRWAASLLTRAGADLYLPVRDCVGAKRTFNEYGVRGHLFKLDLTDTPILRRIMDEIDPAITFNLAGYGIDRSEQCVDVAGVINSDLPAFVCRSLASKQPLDFWEGSRLVHCGTAMEYGAVGGDLREDSETNPTTLYGRTKLAGTEGVATTCRQYGVSGVTARLFAVYGPGESSSRLLPTLINASTQNDPIQFTAGDHKRDFTYVEDVAEALLRLGVARCSPGEIVNVATGVLTPVRSFIQTAAAELGISDGRLRFGALPTREEEMDHEPVNTRRLRTITSWSPGTEIRNGIERTLQVVAESDNSKTERRIQAA